MSLSTAEIRRITVGDGHYVSVSGTYVDGEEERLKVVLDRCSPAVKQYIYGHVCDALNGSMPGDIATRALLGYRRPLHRDDLVESNFNEKFGAISALVTGGRLELFFNRRKLTKEQEKPAVVRIGGSLLGRVRNRP